MSPPMPPVPPCLRPASQPCSVCLFLLVTLLPPRFRRQLNDMIGRQTTWTRLYKATKETLSAAAFHDSCDNKGPTVSVVRAQNGTLAGGYASSAWSSAQNWVRDDDAFLFSNAKDADRMTKFPIRPDYVQVALWHDSDEGPCFGTGHDLVIFADGSSLTWSESYTAGDGELLGVVGGDGGNNFKWDGLEVFSV